MPSLHIGRKRVITLTASDGSTIPAGAVTATAIPSGIVSLAVDAPTNAVTVTGTATGTTSVQYTAPGYQQASEAFTVAPLPSLVITDGPEI